MVIYEKIYKQHGLSKSQQAIIKIVGLNKVVLEVGSSTGYMTKSFLKNGCIVDVVETNKTVLAKLPKRVRKILNRSIEEKGIEQVLARDYDFLILADVLEHLIDPSAALKTLYKISSNKTCLIISLPNVASWVMRKQLFFDGDFEYQESGILDKTHLHFYSVHTLPKLLLENGWGVDRVMGTITRLPLEGVINRIPILGWFFRSFLYQKIVQKYQNLSYYHFVTTAFKK